MASTTPDDRGRHGDAGAVAADQVLTAPCARRCGPAHQRFARAAAAVVEQAGRDSQAFLQRATCQERQIMVEVVGCQGRGITGSQVGQCTPAEESVPDRRGPAARRWSA
jgi:hypothetical protein